MHSYGEEQGFTSRHVDVDPLRVVKLIQVRPKVYSVDGQDKLNAQLEYRAQRSMIVERLRRRSLKPN